MGFNTLFLEISAVENAVVRRLLKKSALVSTMHHNYDTAGPMYRPFIKARIRDGVQKLKRGDLVEGDAQIHTLVQELVNRLVLYQHAPDVEVKRWAHIAVELRDDPEACALLCSFCDDRIAILVKSVLSWMVSECNRRGCQVRALSA